MSYNDAPATPDSPVPANPGRRTALKGAAAAGVAAVVWAEPSIKGLARRPAYAAGGSQPEVEVTITGSVTVAGGVTTVNITSFNPNNVNGNPFTITGDSSPGIILTGTDVSFVGTFGLDEDPDGVLDFPPIDPGNSQRLQVFPGFPTPAFTVIATVQC